MGTIQKIGIADFERLLAAWEPKRSIDAFHVHHTWRPRHRDFRGLATVEAMRRYHIRHAGMRDIAQHLTIDPVGGLWTGRSFDWAPASARGHNGNALRGPFMVEIVGDFDAGEDTFEGSQKTATYAVVLAVLRKFGLDETAVRFHRDFTDQKSCPGTGMNLKAFRADIAALLQGRQRLLLPMRTDAVLDDEAVRSWRDAARTADAAESASVESEFVEVPESEWMLAQQAFLAELIDQGGDAARGSGVDVQPLLPHVVNLSEGLLSTKGAISTGVDSIDTTMSSLRMIVEQHLPDYLATHPDPHLVFYAHGGLVSESGALCYARTILPWWLAHGVYPIFFVWESGLIETLRDSPRAIGPRNIFTDLTDWLLEGVTQIAARKVWKMIKEDSENASSPMIEKYSQAGGAFQLASLLKPLLQAHPKLKLHAIGHSTGPILLSKFMPLLTGAGCRFDTLSYLAPAIRTDRFKERVLPLLEDGAKPAVKDLTLYTMTDDAERDDDVAHVYRKSLLYFVRDACEDRDDGRVLGLARDLQADSALVARFGLKKGSGQLSSRNGPCAIEFSPSHEADRQNPKTAATAHGGFDNDAATMTAVLTRILGHAPVIDRTEKQFPGEAAFKRCGDAAQGRDLAPEAGGNDAPCACCCCACRQKPPPARFGDDVEPDDGADADGSSDDDGGAPAGPGSSPAGATPSGKRNARKLALCIGINSYASQPLSGCVNDSKRWADTLATLGFKVKRIVDRDATRSAIVQGLRDLVAGAREGDELVFQYAGHGTQVEDDDGDERDRFDEAFVPIDYDSGALLLDDDFYRETETLRKGAFLTMFMDCCHSGSNSRFAPRGVSTGRRGSDDRVRFMPMSEAAKRTFFAARKRKAVRGGGGGERPALPGLLHFAACRDSEYAWESNGQGDFTGIATPLLVEAARKGMSNQDFIAAVVKQFGARPRQNPLLLKPAEGLSARRVLGGE